MNKETKKRISPQQKRINELISKVDDLETELANCKEEIEKTEEIKVALRTFLNVKEDEGDTSDDFMTREDVHDMIDEELDNLSISTDITLER